MPEIGDRWRIALTQAGTDTVTAITSRAQPTPEGAVGDPRSPNSQDDFLHNVSFTFFEDPSAN